MGVPDYRIFLMLSGICIFEENTEKQGRKIRINYECGICKLGKRENCFEFVPCLCNMDERNYRNEGGQLHRTKTLAQGDDCCNFHVTRI